MLAAEGMAFDLFGTLVLQEQFSFDQCLDALYDNLLSSGLPLEKGTFMQAYREVNRQLMRQAMAEGRETHNRLWVAGALQTLGYPIAADDPCVAHAVEAYFEPFVKSCQLIPETREMLQTVAKRHRLALLSNFTHPPAVDRILTCLGVAEFFDVVLVSGRVGVRKPHPKIFAALTEEMQLSPGEIIFVGDELEADIVGARNAGMQTIWMNYRQRLERPSPLGQFLGLSEVADHVRPDYVIGSWGELLALLG
ncbi:MAG TPA: HAD family hydrolase [Alphaproteobacteria bacterium]|nr:HAD family hydrolase [Alphaproteobacteria bacterium]